jgi:hypothetical protein
MPEQKRSPWIPGKGKSRWHSTIGPSKSDENNFNYSLHLAYKFCQLKLLLAHSGEHFQPEAETVSQQNYPRRRDGNQIPAKSDEAS